MVTIKDVAKKAGVNPSTVSRALKNSHSISLKTKEKVRKAMDDLGYVPNFAAQMLASGLTQCVGVILPPLTSSDRISQPFFMEILTTINDEAKKKDFTVSIATGDSPESLRDQAKIMYRQKRVDGFIVLYSKKNDPVSLYLSQHNIPFVVVGSQESQEEAITYIDNDNQLMAKTAVDYLYEKGHKNILFITDDEQATVNSERFLGYTLGTKILKIKNYGSTLFDRHDPLSLDNVIKKIKNENITALIVIDDMLSVRVIQFLSFYNIKVPEHISIISFNNSVYSKIIHPYLTTFDINIKQLGKSSLLGLLDKLHHKKKSYQKETVPFLLKERESVRDLYKL
ncbi:LacI family DNA-binding transcriptional regulator [Streptococcus pacificus]|uniref:LacI family DNA-binding transcriptional regulator n=1 Tax=Streptococcus pacificus TaxID=2740577 RepID=A0ABS0ZIU3_9STRE|nr:LacI family DNA-binding transcriptional regulator [Streptococcus pacificus]MBJ8325931.1 LacI family DNA-binding transcriptional regulator [Streptococcus pacificus]